MKKIILFLLFLTFQICTPSIIFAKAKNLQDFDKNLQIELLEMCEAEQNLRIQWVDASHDVKAEEEWRQKVIEIDDFHLIRLQKIIEDYGWPGYSLVSPEGSHAFWLLVQHTPDYLFQNACLELLEQAVLNDDASAIDLAYLKDRVYMHVGKKQIYGTQLNENLTFYPIEDEEHVDERRLAIGLPTLEEYLKVIKEIYGNKK